MRLFTLALFLTLAPALSAQTVPLQLWDHVVGDDILHNRVLPAGTDVWVVTKDEARAVRLRDGYGEVAALLPQATRDRIGGDGYTEGRYRRTAAAGRAYYVLARLPDGRLFQSYVKTGDAGMQPGFDDVQTGRISMGQVPEAVAASLGSALVAAPAEEGPTPAERAAPGVPEDSAAQAPEDVALPALGGAMLQPDTAAPIPVPMQEVEDDAPYLASEDEAGTRNEPAPRRGWLWLLGGLVLGAAAAYFGTAAHYERLLRRQRENMLRYVPEPAPSYDPPAPAGAVPPFLPTTVAALAEQASHREGGEAHGEAADEDDGDERPGPASAPDASGTPERG